VRNRALFDATHVVQHPADCFGDTGAACGPLMVGLAAGAMKHGRQRGPALVYASSDRGLRAAVVVSAPAAAH
jgi:3-oxoacyl-[acyl-carrier-protein] synthase-1